MSKQTAGTATTINRMRLLSPSLPVAEASAEQLRRRIRSAIRVQNHPAAVRAEALAELKRRHGSELVETAIQEDGLLGRASPEPRRPPSGYPLPTRLLLTVEKRGQAQACPKPKQFSPRLKQWPTP